MENFRILCLDGGGIKGAYTAGVLASLEKTTRRRIIDHFDLITGTSIGGIIAIALGLGIQTDELVSFFQESGPKIFKQSGFLGHTGKTLRQIIMPKHSPKVIRTELAKIFGVRKLGESACRLVINTYDAVRGRIFLLKTAHHERFILDYNSAAVDVALSTSAAPTYFPAASFPEHKNNAYIDGGIWANSPDMVGITEAVHFLGIPLEKICLLSIGTTSEPFDVSEKKNSGLVPWSTRLINLMMNAQEESCRAQANLLLDQRYHRINTMVRPKRFKLDDAALPVINDLIQLGRGEGAIRDHTEKVESMFLNGSQVQPFVPIRKPGE